MFEHRRILGEKKAPYLTIFIGGNHEASTYLRELYFGGWAAPNIYFLGASGCINLVKGRSRMRIAGLSGIYKRHDFTKNYDPLPFTDKTKFNIYHVRDFDIYKLSLVLEPQGPS